MKQRVAVQALLKSKVRISPICLCATRNPNGVKGLLAVLREPQKV